MGFPPSGEIGNTLQGKDEDQRGEQAKFRGKTQVQLVVGGQGGNTKMLSEQAKGEKEQEKNN